MSELPESGFLDALDDIIFGFDETGTPVVWNQAALDVTGYSEEELARMGPADFFDEEDATRVRDAITELFETGDALVEAELMTADGRRIPYEFKARRLATDEPVTFVGIGRDITERRRQRELIESREQVLREMYDIIADRQRSFSEQVEALLALGRTELDADYGTLSHIEGDDYLFEIVHTDDDSIRPGDVVPLSATNCEIAASSEQTLVLGDIARDAPKETDRAGYTDWGISCYIGAPVFGNGHVYGTFCFYDTEPRDGRFSDWEITLVDLMSRWVSYELQRKQTNEQLQRQNERLEQFTSVVSHDLRNPLNIVGGSVELAEETGDLEHLTPARRAIERMDALIDDLLTLSRSGEVIGETEEIDLSAISNRSWENVSTADATLTVDTDQTVRADRTRLRQLLENVFQNAVEHGGDAVTVRMGELADGFYVEDDGPGIPESDRQAVFESGYSTTSEGTGFGLAIVAEVANAHGWEVSIGDSSDGGVRFEFTNLGRSR